MRNIFFALKKARPVLDIMAAKQDSDLTSEIRKLIESDFLGTLNKHK
jgi:hypothetical protein